MKVTQVDLPPGNGRGIHWFEVDRASGALTPAGVYEMGTSPSCLAFNADKTRLYSGNETERVGDNESGTVSAFAIENDGSLKLLNSVSSGGKGPAHLSVHPSGQFVLVANYFGGSVAVLPIQPDGSLGEAKEVKKDAGKIGPTKASNAPPGSFSISGHDQTHAHMIEADPSGKFVIHVDLGARSNPRVEVRRGQRHTHSRRNTVYFAASRRRSTSLRLPSEWALVLLDPGGRLDGRVV